MYFCYLIIISPWKRLGTFIWANFNFLNPRILSAKIGRNWFHWFSRTRNQKKNSMYFSYFVIISPLEGETRKLVHFYNQLVQIFTNISLRTLKYLISRYIYIFCLDQLKLATVIYLSAMEIKFDNNVDSDNEIPTCNFVM